LEKGLVPTLIEKDGIQLGLPQLYKYLLKSRETEKASKIQQKDSIGTLFE
jgi:hypothetical protein